MGEDILNKIREILSVKNALLTYGTDGEIYHLEQKHLVRYRLFLKILQEIRKCGPLRVQIFSDPAFQNQEQVTYLGKSSL